MPAVAGQFPEIRKAVRAVVEWGFDQGGHGAVGTPEQTADVAVAGFVDERQHVGSAFKGVVEADGGPESEAGPFEDLFDEIFAFEDFLSLLVRRDGLAAEGVVAEELVTPGVRGDFEERIGEEVFELGGIGFEGRAGDEERGGHFEALWISTILRQATRQAGDSVS